MQFYQKALGLGNEVDKSETVEYESFALKFEIFVLNSER